jgi:hypothetical protein
MFRRSLTVFAGVALGACVVSVAAVPSGAARTHGHQTPRGHGVVVHVSPTRGLSNAEALTVRGSGLPKSHDGSNHTWFVSLCVPRAAKVRNLDPDYSPYCSPTLVQALNVSPAGTFTTQFHVGTGKVGNGHCGIPRHDTCLVAVGTGMGQHVVVTVHFKNLTVPSPKSSSTTTTKP